MSIFKFETSFPFPILKVNTIINHTEVSKPTGISYIILVLINESANKNENLANLLIQFGVPQDLHGIFADEIYKLINDLEIIKVENSRSYHKAYFRVYNVGDFGFTEKGKKVFKEELIPSNKAIESKQEVYYSPAEKLLLEKIPPDWKLGKIDISVLPNDIAYRNEYKEEAELEEYLNSKKGKGIIVKKDEVITNVAIMGNDYFFTTFPATLLIDNADQSISIDLDNRLIQTFFEANYDGNLIGEILAIKKKFKFGYGLYKTNESSIINGRKIFMPEDYEEILNQRAPLIITKANYLPKQKEHVLESETLIATMNAHFETIHISSNKEAFAYIPAQIPLRIKGRQDSVLVNLLLEHQFVEEEFAILTEALGHTFKTYNIERLKELFYIFKTLDNKEALVKIIEAYFGDDIEINIAILKEIQTTTDVSFVQEWFNAQMAKIFNVYFNDLRLETIERKMAVGGWIIKNLKIQDVVLINKIIERNQDVDKIVLFGLLEKLGYAHSDIFAQLNIIDELIRKALQPDSITLSGPFADLLKTLQFGLNELKNLSGIENAYQFVIKEDINRQQFQDVYKGFVTKLNELLKLAKGSSEVLDELKAYDKHFNYLNKLFNDEKSASQNPKSIDAKFIATKIDNKDYFGAVVYLFAKLEWIIKEQYKLKGKTEEMINELGTIEELKTHVDELHQLRKMRNKLLHPTSDAISLTAEELKRWNNIVFKEVNKQ